MCPAVSDIFEIERIVSLHISSGIPVRLETTLAACSAFYGWKHWFGFSCNFIGRFLPALNQPLV